MNKKILTRRDFLKIAGTTAIIAVPALSGYELLHEVEGDTPPALSPYVEMESTGFSASQNETSASILLLVPDHSNNPFGIYLSEILRAEGLNQFQIASLPSTSLEGLGRYDIVLLAEGTLNTSQSEMLREYVARGGRLVAMRPDRLLADLFGVENVSGVLEEGYMQVESAHPLADGITTEAIQYHGSADLYRLAGGQAIAWLSADGQPGKAYPAVTIYHFGEGQAALWAFDLARSVATMRQGNPSLSNQEQDGFNGIRTVDLFVGWIDLDRIAIPQADEQQRLLANLLNELSQEKRPLPRLWYFPINAEGILIATGDSHMNPAPFIEELLTRFEKYSGHISIYYSPVLENDLGRAIRRVRFWITDHVPKVGELLGGMYGSPTPSIVSQWRARGHEFTLHPWVEEGLENGWDKYWKEFTGRGYGPVSTTVRTHRILWSGWVETARFQATRGIRMNCDYYHVGPSFQNKAGQWVCGHLNGSGRPMKFVDEQGQILNIYQQLTQLTDEHLIAMDVPGWGGWPDLSPVEAVEVSKLLLDRSVKQGDHTAITAQFHVDPFQVGGEAAQKASIFLEGTLSYAQELGIPIWSASEWLNFSDARHDTNLANLNWNAETKRLQFDLKGPTQSDQILTVMLPIRHNDRSLSTVDVDGSRSEYVERKLGATLYACVPVNAATHQFRAAYV